jgi:inner membrane protein
MDNLCHTLAGAALGEAGLKRRTAMAMGTLMIASNLPDVDIAVFATDTLAMSFRRGWTHGVVAMAVLPAVLAAITFAIGRARRNRRASGSLEPPTIQPPLSFRGLLLVSYIATLLHVFMDWLNSYGVRLLMPFSNQWFYGDALYIVDPLLYLFLGAAIVLSRRAMKKGSVTPWRPAQRGLTVATVYVVLMLASNWWARGEVRHELRRVGRAETRFMVTPVFGNPIRREVVVDTGDRYEKGVLWFDPEPHFRPLGYGVNTNRTAPEAIRAAQASRFQAYLRWSRFPFFVIERSAAGTRVFLDDYRYSGSGRDGWSVISLGQ